MATNWRDRCKGKLTSVRRAIAMIRRGEHILLSDGSATPLGIMQELVSPEAPLGDNEILHMMTLGEAPYVRPEMIGRFRHNAIFIGANVRQAIADGRADYTPVFLSEVPALIRSRRIEVDVVIAAVSPPDSEGYCTFGTHVDIMPAGAEAARLVIAQVNSRMPRTFGPARLHVDQIHAMVETDYPLPELKVPPSSPEIQAIARHVADLVPNGATLQLGIGGLPNAVADMLHHHRDLGIHSEMISDAVVNLVERGVVTGRDKTLHPGKIVTSFLMGSQKLYDFVHENPMVEVHPVDYTNDPFVIAKNDHMIAINAALEIDLTGQVCADSIGTQFYSGIGGQVDFIRGAARSKGGKPIIALPSTACNGTVSRIVPRLDDGAGVVTTRGDVHYVVTEYGVADLHGRSVRERAMALITIAHPKFRPWLLAEAKRRRIVYADQVEPPVYVPLYPRELEKPARTRDGLELLLRPVRPTDEAALHDMFYKFSEATIYQRFFAIKRFLPCRQLQQFCTIDYDRDMTLIATIRKNDVETILGMAMYALDRKTGFAEAASVVADDFQNRGIGTLLLRRLTEIAVSRGVKGFTGDVLADNISMLKVFDRCGYPLQSQQRGDVVSLKIPFDRANKPM